MLKKQLEYQQGAQVKPRVWFDGALWQCCTGESLMTGRTPYEAYSKAIKARKLKLGYYRFLQVLSIL